jgi:hypothetical protein
MTTFSAILTNRGPSYLSHMIATTAVRKQTNTDASTALTVETHRPTRTRFRALSRPVTSTQARKCYLRLKLETFWN